MRRLITHQRAVPLEDYYSGDGAFNAMARMFESSWVEDEFTTELLASVGGDRRLAVVIYGTLLSDSVDWLSRPVPALGGVTPASCLRTHRGKVRVKECLMRFPK